MVSGAAITHAAKIRDLVVTRTEQKCLAELFRGLKSKHSISNYSFFVCTIFITKREIDASTLEPKSLEAKLVCYTQGDNGYLV